MADPQQPVFNTEAVDWSDIGYQIFTGALKAFALGNVTDGIVSTLANKEAAVKGMVWKGLLDLAGLAGRGLADLDEAGAPLIAGMVGPVLRGLFASGLTDDQFAKRLATGGGQAAGKAIVDGFLTAVENAGASTGDPSDNGARALAAAAVGATLESTLNAAIPEMLSDILPEVGHFTALAGIPDEIIHTLGLSRLVRQALRPMINAYCTTPATWFYAAKFRQTLLGPGIVAKQITRSRLTKEQGAEIFARHGIPDADQEAIINDALKFMGAAEVYLLVRAAEWSLDDAAQHLVDQGYDEGTAKLLLDTEKIKIIATFEDALATAAVDAYAAGRITDSQLDGYAHGSTFTDQHVAQVKELAIAKKTLTAKPLTAAEAEAGVLAGVLVYQDYRDALAAENRTDDAITMLELMLRKKVDNATSVAQHKADQAAAVAAAKQAKLDAAAAKKTAQEQKLALAERGKPAQLEQAYLQGLIPIERVQEVWTPLYDADTVATLSAALEAKRAALVAKQDAATKAKARAAQRHINIGQMEKAVKDGALTIDRYAQQLTGLGFDAADVQTLTSTLSDDITNAANTKKLHDEAAAAAKVKHVDLATLELLVRRGHETMAAFNATLQGLGYDAPSLAALDDKLQLEIDADAAAAKVKAEAAAKAADKGLSLAEAERATVLGVQTLDWFGSWLIKAGIDVAAQQTILATVTEERQNAEAAQQRRAAADAKRDASRVSVGDLAKAARLGVLSIPQYSAALTARGYTSDQVALETDLLTTEIANTQAALTKKAQAAALAKQKHLNLGQLDTAVKDGQLTIPAYTQRVIDLGFSKDDADLVASVVSDQAAVAQLVKQRKATVAATLAAKHVSLAELETGVLDGLLTLDAFEKRLTDLGFDAGDVGLLGGELAQRQATLQTAAARKAQLAAQDPGKEATRAAFEKAVTENVKTIDDYQAFLVEQGYGDDDVQLYLALEQYTLDKAAAKAAPAP